MTEDTLDAVIVGAGFSGIGTAIQLRKLGFDKITILDRESDLGGTWHVNRYPGLAVDIPSPTYSYWFEPNPYWSRLFAPGHELKRYAEHVADKYDVRRHMRFGIAVEGARWDEDDQIWRVQLRGGETLRCRFLVAATGFLSQPRKPDIEGLADFRGRVIATTAWDDEYDFTNRRVAVVGTGATAVQLIPELAQTVADLTVYQRTPIYVAPKNDFGIPALLQRLFAAVPLTQRAFRLGTDSMYELMFVLGVLHYRSFRWLNTVAAGMSKLLLFLSVRDREVRRKLTPQYDFGCKRPTYSNSYYRTFASPHVHLQTAGIARVEADGVVAGDGTRTAIDTLVLATGFDLWDANFPAFEIIGRDGRNLGKWWRKHGFQAYQGISIPYFPNYLNLASPHAFSLSFFNTMEYQMRHMDRLFGALNERGATTFEVTETANADFLERMTTLQRRTVLHQADCTGARSYYFSPNGETFLRATTTRQTVSEQLDFPLSDYTIV